VKNERLQLLFRKHIQDQLTTEEAGELGGYIDHPQSAQALKSSIREELSHFDENNESAEDQIDRIVDDLENKVMQNINRLQQTHTIQIAAYWRYVAAAVVFLVTGTLVYRYGSHIKKAERSSLTVTQTAIRPGTNRATLVLENGKSMVLNEQVEGIDFRGNQVRYADGSILLKDVGGQSLTLSVPRAGKYKVTLSDGTKVWLNAASSISYPSTFKGEERMVVVSGESYFEVAHDRKHPFIVKSAGQSVTVLGTAFNVNTYTPDKGVVTLISGRINLRTKKGIQKILTPGDQAMVREGNLRISKVDADNFIAWRNDIIVLDDSDIQEIFRQLERWYNVEFVNKGSIGSDKTLSGEIPRNIPLPTILKAIEEQIHVTFKINGRRIMIKS